MLSIQVHAHPTMKNQYTDTWLLNMFTECLLLISNSCSAQWHLNTALCDTVRGYDRAIHSSAAIFIHQCMEWPELFDPDLVFEPDNP